MRHQGAGFSSLKFNDQTALLRSRLADHSWGTFENQSDVESFFNSFHDSLKEIILDTCYESQYN